VILTVQVNSTYQYAKNIKQGHIIMQKTLVTLLLDRSASMQRIKSQLIGLVDADLCLVGAS